MSKNTFEGDFKTSNSEMAIQDNVFKSLLKYRYVAAKLLHAAIDDIRESYTIEEVARGILGVNASETKDMSMYELYTSEIDVLNLEAGGIDEKQIRHDVLFKLALPNKITGEHEVSIVRFTIDIEMQKVGNTSTLGYDLVTRAVYYGASLLRDTLPAKGKYSDIHKVYSIWLCKQPVITGELSDKHYKHSYKMFRHYKDMSKHEDLVAKGVSKSGVTVVDNRADLIEVIFIELPKQLSIRTSEVEELGKAIDSIFREPKSIVYEIESALGDIITETKLAEEVMQVHSNDEIRELALAEGKDKGLAEGRAEGRAETIRAAYSSFMEQLGDRTKALEMTARILKTPLDQIKEIVGD